MSPHRVLPFHINCIVYIYIYIHFVDSSSWSYVLITVDIHRLSIFRRTIVQCTTYCYSFLLKLNKVFFFSFFFLFYTIPEHPSDRPQISVPRLAADWLPRGDRQPSGALWRPLHPLQHVPGGHGEGVATSQNGTSRDTNGPSEWMSEWLGFRRIRRIGYKFWIWI